MSNETRQPDEDDPILSLATGFDKSRKLRDIERL
jgi:hypothetical protein